MTLRILVFLCLLFSSSAFANDTVRAVFKAPVGIAATGLKPMTFGLSSKQIQAIHELTQGEIDFGGIYYRDIAADNAKTVSGTSGFSGFIYPNVPPPALTQPNSTAEQWVGDPELAGQWWLKELNVPEAWPLTTGNGVVIADCDAGYHHDEPDLKDNMLMEHAYDLADKENPEIVNDGPFAYHGTAVAAIMSGVKNDSGTNGIAFNSKVVPLQNFNYDNKDDLDKEEATAACVLRAINTPSVSVIVLENQTANGSSETFVGTREAVRLAIKAGITVVGAGGNYSVELVEEKNDDTGSIIVGALARTGEPAWFTNYGERLTVGAFGEQLHTLYGPNGRFGEFGGTSGATPQVAAAVALMKEVNPFLTPEQARAILGLTRTLTATNAKAGGLLNVSAAVQGALNTLSDLSEWTQRQLFRQHLMAILSSK